MCFEIAVGDYAQMKTKYMGVHPDYIVTDFREPHKKFIERIIRDFTIHEVLLPYELCEVRLKSEKSSKKAASPGHQSCSSRSP